MGQVRTQLKDLDVTITDQTTAHHAELALRDELMSRYVSDITTLEDKLKQSQQQVAAISL